VYFWCPFLDPHITYTPFKYDVRSKIVTELGPLTKSGKDSQDGPKTNAPKNSMNFCPDRWISRPTGGITAEGQGQGEGREEIVAKERRCGSVCKRISFRSSVSASSPITICTSCGECAGKKLDVK